MSPHPNETRRGRARRRRWPAAALLTAPGLALTLALASCGGAAALVVPFITFSFEGVVATDAAGKELQIVQLNLSSSEVPQGKPTGSFNSASLSTRNPVPIAAAPQSITSVTGTYAGSTFNIGVPGAVAPLASAYAGQFVEPDNIVLTPATANGATPPISLVRADNSFRPELDGSHWTGTLAATGQVWELSFQTRPPGLQGDATVLLSGTSAGALTGALSGYAAMRHLEITLVAGGGNAETRLSARMGPPGQTPPTSEALTPAQTMTFSDGSTLTRDP